MYGQPKEHGVLFWQDLPERFCQLWVLLAGSAGNRYGQLEFHSWPNKLEIIPIRPQSMKFSPGWISWEKVLAPSPESSSCTICWKQWSKSSSSKQICCDRYGHRALSHSSPDLLEVIKVMEPKVMHLPPLRFPVQWPFKNLGSSLGHICWIYVL
jgi:hypothetical protein